MELDLAKADYIDHFSHSGPPTQLARLSHPNEFEGLRSHTIQPATLS
jgi:hypothetical protein